MGGAQSAENPQGGDAPRVEVPAGLQRYVPEDLVHYMEDARQALDREEPVIPCELCGTFHGNCAGSQRGFCSAAHKREWFDGNIQILREAKGNVLDHWSDLDADFVMKHAAVAGAALPPFRSLHAKVRAREAQHGRYYKDLFNRLPYEERRKVLELDEVWPPSSGKDLKDRCIQPEEATTMKLNYATGVANYAALWVFSASLAKAMGIDPNQGVASSIKRPQRFLRKAMNTCPEEYAHNDFRHSSDVYRTSIVADELEQLLQMATILECLGRTSYDRHAPMRLLGLEGSRDHYVVERIKNRFVRPAVGGYMDMIVNIRINGYVCEIQLHWRPLYDALGEDGRRVAKWFAHFPADGAGYEEEEAPDTFRSQLSVHAKVQQQQRPGAEPNGGQYQGDLVDGRRHGTGTLYYHSGDRYTGEFHKGQKQGLGTYYYVTGDRYRGDFHQDRMHGRGKYFCFNGELYEGEFKEGMRHGRGVYSFADGTTYDGDWWRNKRMSQEMV